jgi:hypothetical protein
MLPLFLVSGPAGAQTAASGRLEQIPFELPFSLVYESASTDTMTQVLDVPFDECVLYFQESFGARSEMAPGWTIGGQGLDTASQSWRFGLLYEARILYDVVVRRDEAGCAVEVGSDADPIPGGRWRWSYPPLNLSDGTEIAVDPFVIEE